MFPFLLSGLQICGGPVHAASVSVSHMCVGPAVSGRHRFIDLLHPPLTLNFFLPPLLQGSLSPEVGIGLIKTSCLGLKVSRSLTLCPLSGCEYLCLLSSTTEGSFADGG